MSAPSRSLFLSLLASEYASCAAAPSLAAPRRAPGTERELRSLAAASVSAKVPGLAMAFFTRDRAASIVAGTAGGHRPVAGETVFEACSLSKPAFALGVLALADRGALDLDAPISTLVDLRAETDDARVLRITPRHALTHTSGLPNWRLDPEPLRCGFAPGARFAYSGEGMFLLQRAVERVAGTGVAAFMRETILEPLGMASSSYAYGERYRGRLAAPHDAAGRPSAHRTVAIGERFVRLAAERGVPLERWTWPELRAALPALDPRRRPLPLPVFSPVNVAGSLLTTAGDYAAIVRAIARRPAMTAPRVRVAPGVAWGLGVGVEPGRGRTAFQWGDNDGFKAMLACEPGNGRGAVVLTNGDAGIPTAVKLLREFLGADHPGLAWVEAKYV